MSRYLFQVKIHFSSTRCLDPSSPSVGKKSSFPAPTATATASQLPTPEDCQQFGKSQQGACWEAKRQKVSVEEEGEIRCWMPDMAEFMEKRIKVEGVGIKMVRDLTMDDFLRLVTKILSSQICSVAKVIQVTSILQSVLKQTTIPFSDKYV